MNRRFFLMGLPLVLAACATKEDDTVRFLSFGEMRDGDWHVKMPAGKVVEGKPAYIDFGHGVHVPLNKDAFYTLWEGPDYWLTYGAGWAKFRNVANERSQKVAIATMKLLMLTMTFNPEKLIHKNGGWRLKDLKPENFTRGVLQLPGRPFAPQTDLEHKFNNPYLNCFTGMMMTGSGQVSAGSVCASTDAVKTPAICAYLIPKSAVDRMYIRDHAVLDRKRAVAKNG